VTSAPLAPWVGAALAVHALLALATPRAADRRDPTPPPLEIDLAPPAPPVSVPREEPPAPAPDPAPVAAPARPLAPPTPHAPAPAARAAAVLTAAPSAPDTPVSFVTDPSGASFGYGVVMRGGTAEHTSAPGASPAPVAPLPRTPYAPIDTSEPPADWTRAPRLDEADPCGGFFPRHALADTGKVTLAVVVETGGQVTSASVVAESPAGDGFGEAGRRCLRTKVFAPALGRDGRPVRATATVRIRFSR
jgi:TonB family protein